MPDTAAVDIIGKGNWGSSLTAALPDARVITRAAWKRYRDAAPTVWLCLPDGELASAALELAKRWRTSRPAKVLLHSSGALAAEVLAPVRALGVVVGSAHPWMTFPDRKPRSLRGVTFAVEGETAAVRAASLLVREFGGRTLRIAAERKAQYHAFGMMCSPLLVSHLAAAKRIAAAAGLPAETAKQMLSTLVQATLQNWQANGEARSFSGPIARGDAETLARHAASLRNMPEQDVYLALARYAVETLPAHNAAALRRALRSGRHS